MTNSRRRGILARVFMLTLMAFMALPMATSAQWGNQRRDRRDDRRERREDRRDERQERREERRAARRGNSADGYPDWGGSFQLRQTALNAGYNEGIKEGRKDRQHGDRFDFRDEGTYQKGTKDYSSKLGSRELYQRYLRLAFENGYNDGYNGY